MAPTEQPGCVPLYEEAPSLLRAAEDELQRAGVLRELAAKLLMKSSSSPNLMN